MRCMNPFWLRRRRTARGLEPGEGDAQVYCYGLAMAYAGDTLKKRVTPPAVRLQMKRLACLLLFLLISAQADELWAIVPGPFSAPVDVDNDDYLPPEQRMERRESSLPHEPAVQG